MAEVIDILHKLTFEANVDPVKELTKEFGTQIKEVDTLQKEIVDLDALLVKTGANDVKAQKEINAQLDVRKKRVDAITTSIAKQVDGSERLTKSVKQLTVNTNGVGVAFANIVRDAPFGIIGIGNNITQAFDAMSSAFKQMTAQGLSTGQAFAKIAGSLLSFNTLLSVGVTLATVFAMRTGDVGKEAEGAKDKVVDLTKALDDYIRAIKDANNINRLRGTFQLGASEAELNRELDLLRARGASAELIALKEQEISRANQTQLELIKQQLQQAKNRILARAEGEDVSGLARLPEPIQRLVDAKDTGAISKQLAEVTNEILNEENKREAIRLTRLREAAEERQKLREKEAKDIADHIDDLKKYYNDLREDFQTIIGGLGRILSTDEAPIPRANADLNGVNDEIKNGIKNDEDRKKRDRQVTEEMAQYALNTTINTLQQIYDWQLYYLDKEIAIRRERVDQATELAEKGNVEILEAEQDRLRKTEAERERVAQRQLQLNALLQASSAAIAATQAIQVVTNAGASGDPYTTAARIAAAVAALAAGFAFVTNLTQAFKFKDGVIGLDGPGNETSDSIPARLSKGESVMTAAETKKYRPYLEAMRNGTFNAYTKEPIMIGQKQDYGRLEKKLDGVIDAIEGNKISATQRIDKNGVSQLIESYTKQQVRRWR
jgi:hypothetical protein